MIKIYGMKIQFLGTGTSTGVPQIGCKCKVCTSTDTKDKRLRASVLISEGKSKVLIDCGPDVRLQLLNNHIETISGVVISHEHYDHIGGLDDLRPFGETHIYGENRVLEVIVRNMPYCFAQNKYPGVPVFQLHEIDENHFKIGEINIQPIRVMHAKLPILGFRIGNMAYLTDVKTIEDKYIEQLQNLDVLIINALRPNTHISHLSLDEAISLSKKIGARETYFTHMSHDMGLHREVSLLLPEHFQFAFDGLSLNL